MPRARADRPDKPLLLWFDVSSMPRPECELRIAAARRFRVASAARLEREGTGATSPRPDAICFETDVLDASRQQALLEVLQRYPLLPALLLTQQHSEALAAWAFRAGIWNYLVTPVEPAEFAANLDALVRCMRRRPAVRMPQPPQGDPADIASAAPDMHVARLQPALEYVRQRFHEKVTEAEAARLCGLERSAFSRDFHATFGLTFREQLMRTRIWEARRMLAEGGHTVTDVVFASGFTDGSHFARMFRRYTGVLPSAFEAAQS